ncbi:unnamed protein product [Peniophora sp. CBMAI 1063]|nr:unnamed protein product [Peniophora sp. CBMAI 1063]
MILSNAKYSLRIYEVIRARNSQPDLTGDADICNLRRPFTLNQLYDPRFKLLRLVFAFERDLLKEACHLVLHLVGYLQAFLARSGSVCFPYLSMIVARKRFNLLFRVSASSFVHSACQVALPS